jgi:hypothetical protein
MLQSAPKQAGEAVGEITSPKKPKQTRSGHTTTASAGEGAGRGKVRKNLNVAPGNTGRVTGQKRKEYRPKHVNTTAATHPEMPTVPLAIVGVEGSSLEPSVSEGELSGLDSNKKQKKDQEKDSHRSADLAEAAEQPCRTQ